MYVQQHLCVIVKNGRNPQKSTCSKVTATAALQNGSIAEGLKSNNVNYYSYNNTRLLIFAVPDSRLVQKTEPCPQWFLKKAGFRLESVRHQAAVTLTNEKKCLLGILDN
jgi:hypothetical protein